MPSEATEKLVEVSKGWPVEPTFAASRTKTLSVARPNNRHPAPDNWITVPGGPSVGVRLIVRSGGCWPKAALKLNPSAVQNSAAPMPARRPLVTG